MVTLSEALSIVKRFFYFYLAFCPIFRVVENYLLNKELVAMMPL